MQSISENFSIDRIPLADDEVSYGYYDATTTDLVVTAMQDQLGDTFDILFPNYTEFEGTVISGELFLNGEALNAIPESLSYEGTMLLSQVCLLMISLGLRVLILLQLLTQTLFHSLAIVCFLDVSIIWLEASRIAGLNRRSRDMRSRRFKKMIRLIEAFFFIFSMNFVIRLAFTDGQSYSNFLSILIAVASLLIALLFTIGRLRLRTMLSRAVAKLSVDQASSRYSALIRNVSTVVILSNIGVFLGQLYVSYRVTDIEALVTSKNDPVSFLFRPLFR